MTNIGLITPSLSLARRELVRFLRQRNRVIGALATPIIFWLFIGLGMNRSFRAEGMPGGDDYLQYFFPGTVLMVMLFTAIFSTISIIEDRKEGFLQSVLVAPVSRMAIVLGKVLGGTALAAGQGTLFLLLAPLAGISFSLGGFLLSLLVILLTSFALTALGVCIAWRMSSTQGFHAVMNMFLMPMWFLSGALFPASQSQVVMKWVMRANPLSYSLDALRRTMYWAMPEMGMSGAWLGQLGVTIAFGAAMFLLAAKIVSRPVDADFQ